MLKGKWHEQTMISKFVCVCAGTREGTTKIRKRLPIVQILSLKFSSIR